MRKNVLSIMMSAVLLISLAGCSNSQVSETTSKAETASQTEAPSQAETVTAAAAKDNISLRFSWWGGDARHEATLKAIEVYQKAHPNITIEAEYSSFSGYYEKLVTQLASKNAPDMFQVDQGWVAELYKRGDAFADFNTLNDLIDLNTIPQQMMTDYCTIDNQTMVLPFGYNGTVFLYNKTLLADWCDENGNLQIKTWDDLNKIGKELHEKNPEAYMTTTITDGYLRYILKPMLEQITSEIDVKDDFTLGFTEEQLAQAFHSFMQIFSENVSQPYEEAILYDSLQNNPLWLNGNIGGTFLFFSNIDTEIANLDYEYGVTALPMFAEASLSGQECCPSLMVAINKSSDDVHKAASAEFLNWFLNSEEAALILGTVRGVPGSTAALNTLENNQVLSDLMSQGIQISNDTMSLKNGAYELNSSVKAVFVEYMEKVIYKVLSPEDAAVAMTEDLQRVLSDLKGK